MIALVFTIFFFPFCAKPQIILHWSRCVWTLSGMPPHMAPRPGMPHMAPVPAAGAIPSRPVVPAAQPAVAKPLFPSAAQVGSLRTPLHQSRAQLYSLSLFPSVESGNQWICLFVWLESFYEAQPILDLVFSTALLFDSFLYSTKQTLVCFVLLCHCCGLLLTMLQMGSGVHSSTATVSSPPLDLQSVSSQPSFPNTPQVRSQNRECGTCMWPPLLEQCQNSSFVKKADNYPPLLCELCFEHLQRDAGVRAQITPEDKRGGLVVCELY